jgi:sugar phosphate isomerase/epimerase
MNLSRRNFLATGAAAAAAVSLPSFGEAQAIPSGPRNKSYYKGVQLGIQTYSFHEIPNDGAGHADEIIRDMQAVGAYDCELFGCPLSVSTFTGKRPLPDVCPEPLLGCGPGKGGTLRNPWAWAFAHYTGDDLIKARERERKFLTETPDSYYTEFRARFDRAGITIHSYNPYAPHAGGDVARGKGLDKAEMDGLVRSCKALGVKNLNLSTTLATVKELLPYAEKYEIMLCPHGHSITWDKEEFSTTATFEEAFKLSKWVGANLDLGHFAAIGEDPHVFIEKYHDRISNLHLKDRERNAPGVQEETGNNVPWGKGVAPIRETLKFLQAKHYPIPAFVEYEYAGTSDPVTETKKQLAMCRQMLDT